MNIKKLLSLFLQTFTSMKLYKTHWGNCIKTFNDLKPGDLLIDSGLVLLFLNRKKPYFYFLNKNNKIVNLIIRGIY